MRLNKEKLIGLNCEIFPCGNAESPHNGESDACTVDGKLIAFNRYGLGYCDNNNWDWVHKDFRF